jgi:hypothetical protein
VDEEVIVKPLNRKKIIDVEDLAPRIVEWSEEEEADAQMARRSHRVKCFLCDGRSGDAAYTHLDDTGRLIEPGWSKDGSNFRCPKHRVPGVANIGEMIQAKRNRR